LAALCRETFENRSFNAHIQDFGLGDQEGYYRVGMNYAATKEWQKALDNYLKITKPNLATKTLIAEAYDGLGNEDQALIWYKDAADDGSADALVNVGVIYYVKKDFLNAIQAWKKASSLGSGTASYKLARLYVEQNNREEAAKYDKIGAVQGEIGSIFFYGFYLQGKGDFVNAKIWYKIGVDKNDPMSMVQLGAILSSIDDDQIGACQLWQKASDLGNVKAKENIDNYCA
jgi:TPR repeat protein